MTGENQFINEGMGKIFDLKRRFDINIDSKYYLLRYDNITNINSNNSMSLGIIFKGPEGIVLAADSRVTLTAKLPNGDLIPSTFDNATKLLHINKQEFVGVVTYGLGSLGGSNPRTAHSYMPEFETEISGKGRLAVQEFANLLSNFFMKQWENQGMPNPENYQGPLMTFLLAGYNEKDPYGCVYEFSIPTQREPKEWHPGNTFGAVWGGQQEFVGRLIQGYDPSVPSVIQNYLKLTTDQTLKLQEELRAVNVQIPYQFLPLQDCINLSVLLIRTTIEMQSFYVGLRGVGGEIDVATITKTGGYQSVKEKNVAKLFNQRCP